jgi:hypothetical protein
MSMPVCLTGSPEPLKREWFFEPPLSNVMGTAADGLVGSPNQVKPGPCERERSHHWLNESHDIVARVASARANAARISGTGRRWRNWWACWCSEKSVDSKLSLFR